ncbi:MAG: YiiD C-terminal domain-containing protein [Thiothrix sp.]|nr:YiiD C-terminal domain-containing protein [Thiothrix sp.]HPQ97155.1 YiiD C-terminal domain-containing protein [Thiolinea sp.]
MNTAATLQQTIHSRIPLSRAMGFTIVTLDDEHIHASAPLEPNLNIHGTAFAGSLYAVATLTAWALAYHWLERLPFATELVLGRADIRYRQPVQGELHCRLQPEAETRTRFLQAVEQQGRGQLTLAVGINEAAIWQGRLVALQREQPA